MFLIFVCKRNVLKVILKKRDKLYSTVRRNSLNSSGMKKIIIKISILPFVISYYIITRIEIEKLDVFPGRVRYQRKTDDSSSQFSQSYTKTERVTMSEIISHE